MHACAYVCVCAHTYPCFIIFPIIQAQQHEAALHEAQQQLKQHVAAETASSEAAARCHIEIELLQRKVDDLEADRHELLACAEENKAAAIAAREQVTHGVCRALALSAAVVWGLLRFVPWVSLVPQNSCARCSYQVCSHRYNQTLLCMYACCCCHHVGAETAGRAAVAGVGTGCRGVSTATGTAKR